MTPLSSQENFFVDPFPSPRQEDAAANDLLNSGKIQSPDSGKLPSPNLLSPALGQQLHDNIQTPDLRQPTPVRTPDSLPPQSPGLQPQASMQSLLASIRLDRSQSPQQLEQQMQQLEILQAQLREMHLQAQKGKEGNEAITKGTEDKKGEEAESKLDNGKKTSPKSLSTLKDEKVGKQTPLVETRSPSLTPQPSLDLDDSLLKGGLSLSPKASPSKDEQYSDEFESDDSPQDKKKNKPKPKPKPKPKNNKNKKRSKSSSSSSSDSDRSHNSNRRRWKHGGSDSDSDKGKRKGRESVDFGTSREFLSSGEVRKKTPPPKVRFFFFKKKERRKIVCELLC